MAGKALTLRELAERVEALSWPDVSVNADILVALGGTQDGHWAYDPDGNRGRPIPDYLGSLDAAITLVPEGHKLLLAENLNDGNWRASLSYREDDRDPWTHPFCIAASPALALTAAALRALAHNSGVE